MTVTYYPHETPRSRGRCKGWASFDGPCMDCEACCPDDGREDDTTEEYDDEPRALREDEEMDDVL